MVLFPRPSPDPGVLIEPSGFVDKRLSDLRVDYMSGADRLIQEHGRIFCLATRTTIQPT